MTGWSSAGGTGGWGAGGPPTGQPWVAVRETHSGVVVLWGDRAVKFKKPVDLGYLDFRAVADRRRHCQREITLNRRLAPDVYLGVAEVSDPAGGPPEPAVVMRRLPEDARLTAVVRRGSGVRNVIDEIARMVASFHSTARRGAAIDAQAMPAAISARWESTFADIARDGGDLLDVAHLRVVRDHVHDFLTGRERLFRSRITAGRVVDGHADLLCDDIFCLADGPRILDCLDFDDTLRYVDGLDDVACLAMDLEALGSPYAARYLFERYTAYAADPAPASLWHHYVAYRAFVRLKVACLRARDHDKDAGRTARTLLDCAVRHLRAGQVRLILVGGLPGSGKSTVAGGLADRLHAVLLSSDVLREQEVEPAAGPAPAAFGCGRYDRQHRDQVYQEIFRRAEVLLEMGETVVVDASFVDTGHRLLAEKVAYRTFSRLIGLRCVAPPEVREQRLRDRPAGPSQATVDIARVMAKAADPWPDSIGLPTTGEPERTLDLALEVVGGGDRPMGAGDV